MSLQPDDSFAFDETLTQRAGDVVDVSDIEPILNDLATALSTVSLERLRSDAVTSYMLTVLLAGDAATARSLLGVAGGDITWDVVARSASATLIPDDDGKLQSCDAQGGSFSITLPTAASAVGKAPYVIQKIDASANTVDVETQGAETINGLAAWSLNHQWNGIKLRTDGTNWFVTDELDDEIDTSEIADGAITAAKLASDAVGTPYSRTLIAAASAAAARTVLGLGGLATLNILDEDDMASDSPSNPPSQQSVRAYFKNNSMWFPIQRFVLDGTANTLSILGFNDPLSFNKYMVDVTDFDLDGATNDFLAIQFAEGGVFKTAPSDYTWAAGWFGGTANASDPTADYMRASFYQINGSRLSHGHFEFGGVDSASQETTFTGELLTNTTPARDNARGNANAAYVTDGLRFYTLGGTNFSAIITIYGAP